MNNKGIQKKFENVYISDVSDRSITLDTDWSSHTRGPIIIDPVDVKYFRLLAIRLVGNLEDEIEYRLSEYERDRRLEEVKNSSQTLEKVERTLDRFLHKLEAVEKSGRTILDYDANKLIEILKSKLSAKDFVIKEHLYRFDYMSLNMIILSKDEHQDIGFNLDLQTGYAIIHRSRYINDLVVEMYDSFELLTDRGIIKETTATSSF